MILRPHLPQQPSRRRLQPGLVIGASPLSSVHPRFRPQMVAGCRLARTRRRGRSPLPLQRRRDPPRERTCRSILQTAPSPLRTWRRSSPRRLSARYGRESRQGTQSGAPRCFRPAKRVRPYRAAPLETALVSAPRVSQYDVNALLMPWGGSASSSWYELHRGPNLGRIARRAHRVACRRSRRLLRT